MSSRASFGHNGDPPWRAASGLRPSSPRWGTPPQQRSARRRKPRRARHDGAACCVRGPRCSVTGLGSNKIGDVGCEDAISFKSESAASCRSANGLARRDAYEMGETTGGGDVTALDSSASHSREQIWLPSAVNRIGPRQRLHHPCGVVASGECTGGGPRRGVANGRCSSSREAGELGMCAADGVGEGGASTHSAAKLGPCAGGGGGRGGESAGSTAEHGSCEGSGGEEGDASTDSAESVTTQASSSCGDSNGGVISWYLADVGGREDSDASDATAATDASLHDAADGGHVVSTSLDRSAVTVTRPHGGDGRRCFVEGAVCEPTLGLAGHLEPESLRTASAVARQTGESSSTLVS